MTTSIRETIATLADHEAGSGDRDAHDIALADFRRALAERPVSTALALLDHWADTRADREAKR